MSKHTPGPWAVQLPADDSARIRVVDKRALDYANHRIADLQYWSSKERGPDRDGAIANAYLIAAAHDLLEALQGVLRVADRATDEFHVARSAIAKAIGEKQ